MERSPVSSSNIKSIGYERTLMILEVEFKNGHIYQYMNVPNNIFQEIMNASSCGTYLHQNVMNRFGFEKIR
jgi:hypothetical protein